MTGLFFFDIVNFVNHLLNLLKPYIRPYGKHLLGALLFSILLSLIKIGQAYIIKPIFNKGLSAHSSKEEIFLLVGILILLALINIPVRFFHFYWTRYVVLASACDIRQKVFEKIQRTDLERINQEKDGDLLSKMMTDIQVLAVGTQGLIDLIREPLLALSMFCFAIYLDWQLTLVIVIVAPLFFIIFNFCGKKVKKFQLAVQEHIGNLTHTIIENLEGQKTIKANNFSLFFKNRFSNIQSLAFNSQMKANAVEELASPSVEFVGSLAFVGILFFAQFKIVNYKMSSGEFISFVTTLLFLMDPIRKFSRINLKINQAHAASQRVLPLLKFNKEVDQGEEKLEDFKSLEFKNVSLTLGDRMVLNQLSFSMKSAERLAFVGPSGSGKSTILNLILRFLKPDSGEILVNGKKIENYTLESLRHTFNYVGQDIFLFNDTVFENLTLNKEVSKQKIEAVVKDSYCQDFIEQLENKLDTMVGDQGGRLSGGQAQRLTIARALLQKGSLLLFDEATSALDNESEQKIKESLGKMSLGKSIISIAHRLTTIEDFDLIIVLDSGKIVEQGRHQDLLSKKGQYFSLYKGSQI